MQFSAYVSRKLQQAQHEYFISPSLVYIPPVFYNDRKQIHNNVNDTVRGIEDTVILGSN